MKIAVACLVGLVLSVGIVWAEPVVEGRVRLASGEAAVGAQVLLFDLADLSRYVRATTDESGQFVLSLGALGQGQGLPEGFGLGQNYPNPFNPGTVIPYELAADGYVRLEVFNLLGQRVAVLVDGEMGVGRYTAEWDARDASGQGVAAGVYVYRLTVGGGVATRRMTLVDGAASTGSASGGMGSMGGMQGADEGGYGLTVAGVGVETYVDADFRVVVGAVEVVVEAAASTSSASRGSGKVAQGGVLGDVNNDGRVNISDALIVATYSVNAGIVVPNNGDIQLGDVNADGRVNISDALILATYSIDPTNPALPAGIGEPIETELVALGDLIEAIEPLEGMPGTMITLTGAFEAEAEYEVRFDTVAVVGYARQEGRLAAMVPVVPQGRVQVRVVTAGGQSDAVAFEVLALPAPRMDAAQLQQEVVGAGQAIGTALAALTEADGIYSGADADLFNREMAKLNAAWMVIGERIAALSPEQAALLTQLLDNSGALAVLEGLAGMGAPKAAIGETIKHYAFFKLDALSFLLANVNAVLGPASLIAWIAPGGQPVATVLTTIQAVSSGVKDIIDTVVPTDLEHITVEVQTTPLTVGETTEVAYVGDFFTQDNAIIGGARIGVHLMVNLGKRMGPGPPGVKAEIIATVGELLAEAGINAMDVQGAEALASLKRESNGVPLNMSLYRLDIFSLFGVLIPPLPTHALSNLLEKVGVDLSVVTLFAPVEVENDALAQYQTADAELTGLAEGRTRLRVRAFKFVLWHSLWNVLGVHKPEVVGPMYSARFAVEAANRVPVLGSLADRSVVAGESLTIRLSGSDADGDALRYGVSGAPGGALSGDTFRWTPSAGQVGTHRVVFTVSDGRGGEATRTVTIRVTAPAVPDMVVDRLTLLPAAIETHTPVTVQVRVANVGDGRARQAVVVLRVNGRVVDTIALDFDAGSETGVEFDPQVLGAGSHSIEVVVDPEGNLTSETVRGNNRVSQTLTLTPPLASARSVVFVLDLSGSMDDAAGDGGTRLEAAKAALAQVLARAPTDGSQEYALTTFGGGCDVRVPIDFTGDPQAVVDYSAGLYADGSTPLAAALRRGQHLALDAASSDDVLLVLLSDGEETCDGDPVGVARLIGQGVRAKVVASLGTQAKVISVNAIGFGVEPGSSADQQIQAIAKEAGGNYFRASETADLAVALGQASGLVQTRVPTLSGQVTDEEGNPIQGALVQLRNMQENTDANGRYLFPNNAGVQGVDSLIVMAAGYARYAAEVYLFEADKEYDVALGFDAAAYPVAEASADRVSVVSGDQVTLRGDRSSDPSGSELTYHWSQLPSNPFPVSFSQNDSENAFAVRVTLTDVGKYHFVLEVENEVGLWSMPDTVAIGVRPPGTEQVFSLLGGGEMAFVWIGPGVFQMGSPDSERGRRSYEGPLHEVELSRGFWLGKYEVTVGQFRRFVDKTGYDAGNRCWTYENGDWEGRSGRNWSYPGYSPSDDEPVVCVSWEDVQTYAGWLSSETVAVYRLPTEAEWEYACRAGTSTPWSFGDDESDLTDYAWYDANTKNTGEVYPHAVGTKGANPWGLYDMHGNVYEWVQDRFSHDYYKSSPRVDPPGPTSGSDRVGRGGDISVHAHDVRSAHRGAGPPDIRSSGVGVRLVRGDTRFVEARRVRSFSLPGGGEMAFVWIGPGVFQMGSPESEEGRDSDEGPLHEVELSRGFWLGKYEVTQGGWEAVMGDNPSYFEGDARRPVERVSWYDVHEFIGRLNAAAGDSLYRLPSEAEWEYACRAGTSTRWSFGDDEGRLGDYAWYDGNNDPWGTKAVGGKLPNPWGLYDMHGNVYEWVQDRFSYDYDYYKSSPRVDPPGPTSGSFRVFRGGIFASYARGVRSAARDRVSPGYRDSRIGVRLLRIR